MGETGHGWLKLFRKILDTDIFQKPEWVQLWVYCLCRANHTGASVYVAGLAEPVKLKPGQFIAGQSEIKKALHSDKTAATMYIWMNAFVERGMLAKEVMSYRCTIWTVCNWARYQSPPTRKEKADAKIKTRQGPEEAGEQEEKQEVSEIPAWLEAVWKDWGEACREAGKPLSPTRVKYQLKKLQPYDHATQVEMVKLAITNRWNDFYPVNTKRKSNARSGTQLGPCPEQQYDEPAQPE